MVLFLRCSSYRTHASLFLFFLFRRLNKSSICGSNWNTMFPYLSSLSSLSISLIRYFSFQYFLFRENWILKNMLMHFLFLWLKLRLKCLILSYHFNFIRDWFKILYSMYLLYSVWLSNYQSKFSVQFSYISSTFWSSTIDLWYGNYSFYLFFH